METWGRVGLVSACSAFSLLLIEHFLPHGGRLGPVDHWLSEYVLSDCAPAVWMMRLAFVALAMSALAVAMLSEGRALKLLFKVSAVGLAAMTFLDTYPNHGKQYPHWPPTPGNLHQDMLYLAIGATLLGMGLHLYRTRSNVDAWLVGLALLATCVQTWLVMQSESLHQMTRFGGVTERVIVVAMMIWVVRFCGKNLKSQISNLKSQIENGNPTSDIRHPTSDIRHPTSDIRIKKASLSQRDA